MKYIRNVKWLLLFTLALLGPLVLAQTPIETVPKPTFQGAVKFTIPGHDKKQHVDAPDSTILLPKGAKHGYEPFIFVGGKGAFVSVIIETLGADAASMYKSPFDKDPESHKIKAGIWRGEYSEQMLEDNVRRGRLYALCSPKVFYTMMVSWPDKDAVAKKEALAMAQDVIWSFKLH